MLIFLTCFNLSVSAALGLACRLSSELSRLPSEKYMDPSSLFDHFIPEKIWSWRPNSRPVYQVVIQCSAIRSADNLDRNIPGLSIEQDEKDWVCVCAPEMDWVRSVPDTIESTRLVAKDSAACFLPSGVSPCGNKQNPCICHL